MVADALSRLPYEYVLQKELAQAQGTAKYLIAYDQGEKIQIVEDCSISQFHMVMALANASPKSAFKIEVDQGLLTRIKEAYAKDPWCTKLKSASTGMNTLEQRDGLWFIGEL